MAARADGRCWRIGTVPYRVARPLTLGLDRAPEVELTVAPPAELARLLHAGELDVALASSVLALGERALPIWDSGPVIASDGPVRSVLLMVRPGVEPTQIRRWVADPHSRTGRALAAIALHEQFGVDTEQVESEVGSLFATADACGADAVQVIGDPALRALLECRDWTVVDLGASWKQLTGLPFIFAGWVGAPGSDPAAAQAVLEAAAERGLAERERFAAEAGADGSPESALGERFFLRYFMEDMRYRLPAEHVRASLRAFGERAKV